MNTVPPTTPPAGAPRRRLFRGLAATLALGVAGVALVGAGIGSTTQAADAASTPMSMSTSPKASATDGWMRVAHLSPDTKAVNVTLTALRGGSTVFELDNVSYGAVSNYVHVPAGTYVVSMSPWSATGTVKPVLTASVKIVKDKTITVAALGKNSALTTRVFQDDLAAPKKGEARIRLIQASTVVPAVNVQTSTGLLIAKGAQSGVSTSYASVPSGAWKLNLSATGIADTTSVKLATGSVNTLFVLDNAENGLTVKSVLDSASVGNKPLGGINTGGGYLATHPGAALPLPGDLG